MLPLDWLPAPARPQISPDEVGMFSFALDLPRDRLAQLRALLSPDEQARADRLIAPRMRDRWTAARGQVREILAACLGADPAGLRFTTNPYGKPSLAGPALQPIRFNASHSGGLGLLAITLDHEVGIDVEMIQETLDRENIARRYFAPGEVETLFRLPDEQQTRAFYACWTRKEAYIKARGMGLSIPLDGFAVSLAPGDPPRLLYPRERWEIYNIEVGEGYAAALVVEQKVKKIYHWQWAP